MCRPHMKEGNPKECAREIVEKRDAVEHLPRDVRIAEIAKVFRKHGIPDDIRLRPGAVGAP